VILSPGRCAVYWKLYRQMEAINADAQGDPVMKRAALIEIQIRMAVHLRTCEGCGDFWMWMEKAKKAGGNGN
jgi:hypothetical protein